MGTFSIYSLSWQGEIRYIGYTSKSLQERLTTHWEARKKKGCHRACWLYSLPHKPHIELIESYDTLQEAHNAERRLIHYHRSIGTRLVNTTDGGDGWNGGKWRKEDYDRFNKRVIQYSPDGAIVAVHQSLSDASESVSGTRRYNGKVSGVCRGKQGRRTFMGFVFRYDGDAFDKYPVEPQYRVTQAQIDAIRLRQSTNNTMKGKTNSQNHNSRAVVQIAPSGEPLKEFPSMSEVYRELGIIGVSQAVRSKGTAGGFYWKYKEDIVRSSQ